MAVIDTNARLRFGGDRTHQHSRKPFIPGFKTA
jgi:hypothetical protein